MTAPWERAETPDANHRRVVAATLRSLDEALCAFDELAAGKETHSVLYHRTNRLSQEQRRAVLAETARVRELLREIAGHLDLPAAADEAASAIWGRCFMLKEALSELEGSRLDAYGAQSPEFRAYVHPMLARLQRHIDTILGVAGAAAGKASTDSTKKGKRPCTGKS